MILYLSVCCEPCLFEKYFQRGLISTGLQVQRFHALLIQGLSNYVEVSAVGQLPMSNDVASDENHIKKDNVDWFCMKKATGKYRPYKRYRSTYKLCDDIIRHNKVEAIIADGVSMLYSSTALSLSKKWHIPALAIVTDIPIFMDPKSIHYRITQFLLKRFDGYIPVTRQANDIVNLRHRPFVVMEGSCDISKKIEQSPKTNERCVCVYAGSLQPETGIENLMDAFCLLNRDDAELHIYGFGPLKDLVKKREKDCAYLQYGGMLSNEEAAKALRNADVLINPRPVDLIYTPYSFPSKLMEYLASGTMVMTTRLPGIPSDYYGNLYSIDNDSVEGIKTALEEVLSWKKERREALGWKGQEFVVNKKSNKAQALRIIELIKSITD